MNTEKILIVDDELPFRMAMRVALRLRGFTVDEAETGEAALEKIRSDRPDLILLDMNLPGLNGLECCREIRAGTEIPIIMLSVRSDSKDKVQALNSGADDYVIKPFNLEELIARLHANLRRVPHLPLGGRKVITLDTVQIDFKARTVKARNRNVQLTRKEFDLLSYLVTNAGEVIPHRKLLQVVWGPHYGDEAEYLRVFVNHLRKKIEPDPSAPKYIITALGMGYRFDLPPGALTAH
ncbi:MAG: response regulator transcription factor [Candidatus Acidiferrum sp.]